MRIRQINQGDRILIGYKETGVFVDIVKFQDYMLGKYKTRYRVDVHGRTVASMIDTKAEAVKIARKHLRMLVLDEVTKGL